MISLVNSKLHDYLGVHKGRSALVQGGAPSRGREAELALRVLRDPVLYSANDHAAKRMLCSYITACDNIQDRLRPFGIPIISQKPWADIIVERNTYPSNSAALGAYAAAVMGCEPIVIVGVECYTGDTYEDDPDAFSTGKAWPVEKHLELWGRLKECAPYAKFRVIDGPLKKLFSTL